MKNYGIGLLLSMLAFSTVYADVKMDPTTYLDVEISAPPRITLRSLFTGEPVQNDHYGKRSPINKHWELIDYTGEEKYQKFRDGGTLVQFKVVGATKCFAFQSMKECSDKDSTVFSLIPTNTGAFIIRDMILGFCLTSRDFGALNLEPCGYSVKGKHFSLAYQWGILPPFGPSKILRPPI